LLSLPGVQETLKKTVWNDTDDVTTTTNAIDKSVITPKNPA